MPANANDPIDQNLILTGYIGPGQLAIARRAAERLRMPFVDFESVLEDRAGLAGEELRIRFGEARLKTLESELVTEVALYRGTVIHISGKTLMPHFARMSETGPVICIVADARRGAAPSASGAGRALSQPAASASWRSARCGASGRSASSRASPRSTRRT